MRGISLFYPRKLHLKCKNSICSTQKTVCYIELSIFAISRFCLRLIQARCGFHPGKINASFIWHDIINRYDKYLFSKKSVFEKTKCHFFTCIWFLQFKYILYFLVSYMSGESMGTMHTESKKAMHLLSGARSSHQSHNCKLKRNSIIPLKAVSLNVYNEHAKNRIWSCSLLRRWEGKGEAEEKSYNWIRKNLVSVSGKHPKRD